MSTSYYAAFHAVVEGSVSILFRSVKAQEAARGWFDHEPVTAVAQSLASCPRAGSSALAARLKNAGRSLGIDHHIDDPLRRFVQRFEQLHTKRMQADYFKPSGVNLAHADAIVAIGNAEQICGYIGTWPSDPNPHPAYTLLRSEDPVWATSCSTASRILESLGDEKSTRDRYIFAASFSKSRRSTTRPATSDWIRHFR